MKQKRLRGVVRIVIAAVWIFHGLYSKILDGIPRHRLIVGQILGEEVARPLAVLIGVGEILLGLWVLSGRRAFACALFQNLALVAMNTSEILFARELLISAPGMVALNLVLIGCAWWLALAVDSGRRV